MFFETSITLRITEDQKEKITYLLKKHPNKWDNPSHLMRCAINKLYFEVKNDEKKVKK